MSITILHFLQIFLKVKKFAINSTPINSAKKIPQKNLRRNSPYGSPSGGAGGFASIPLEACQTCRACPIAYLHYQPSKMQRPWHLPAFQVCLYSNLRGIPRHVPLKIVGNPPFLRLRQYFCRVVNY